MLLVSLFATAYAFPTVVVGGDAVLETPFAVAYATILQAGNGDLRILAVSGGVEHLLVETPSAWVNQPFPKGRLVEGPVDVVAMLDPPQDGVARMMLNGAGWLPLYGPAVTGTSVRAIAIQAQGRVSALTYQDDRPVMIREAVSGTWETVPVPINAYNSGWAEGGALWWLDETGIAGPRALRRDLAGVQGWPYGRLDANGDPMLVLWDRGRLEIVQKSATAVLVQPRDVIPTTASCLAAPCDGVQHFAQATGAAPYDQGTLIPYVRTTLRQRRACHPDEGPQPPCDPQGPLDDCPPAPPYTCEFLDESRSHDLRLAFVQGSSVEDISLSELLSWGEADPTVWDVATDARGSVVLLVNVSGGDARPGLHIVRLDPASGRAPPASRVRGASER